MIKKLALAVAALIGTAAAHAQTPNPTPWHVSAAAGYTKMELPCIDGLACDNKGETMKLSAGYDVGGGLSMEAGYIDFGKYGFKPTTALGINIKSTATVLNGALSLPVTESWAVVGRLGVARVKTKLSAYLGTLSGSNSETKSSAYFGAGATFAATKRVKLELAFSGTEAAYAGERRFLTTWTMGTSVSF